MFLWDPMSLLLLGELCNMGYSATQEEQTMKLAGKIRTTKFYKLQPKYMGAKQIKVTVCNVPINLPEQMLTSFLSTFGHIEDVLPLQANSSTISSDFISLIFWKILHHSRYHQLWYLADDGSSRGEHLRQKRLQTKKYEPK